MTPLPEFVDPRVWAEQGNSIAAEVPLKYMPELLAMLDTHVVHEPAYLQLAFGFDPQQRPQVIGRVQAELWLTCQRCSRPVHYAIDESIAAHPVSKADMPTNQSRKDGQGWEDDFVYHENAHGEVGLAPLKLAEDEIILALPLVAMHELGDPECKLAWVDPDLATLDADANDEKTNPFAVLAGLKSNSQPDEQDID